MAKTTVADLEKRVQQLEAQITALMKERQNVGTAKPRGRTPADAKARWEAMQRARQEAMEGRKSVNVSF